MSTISISVFAGGCCRVCGSVEHFQKDCPEHQAASESPRHLIKVSCGGLKKRGSKAFHYMYNRVIVIFLAEAGLRGGTDVNILWQQSELISDNFSNYLNNFKLTTT